MFGTEPIKLDHNYIINDRSVKAEPKIALGVLEWTLREICIKMSAYVEENNINYIDLYGATITLERSPYGLEVRFTVPGAKVFKDDS